MRRWWQGALVSGVTAVLLGLGTVGWAEAGESEPTIRTPMPKHWMPRTPMKCKTVRGIKWRVCDGPRRTPEPYGPAAFKAQELGLGSLDSARKLLKGAPPVEWVQAVKGQARPTLLWPVEHGKFGRGFGYVRKHRRALRHNGVDVGAPVGELVRSLNDGIVAYSDNQISGFGNTVVVVHKDKSVSFYCHQRSNFVFAGQQVKRGQVVGEVGLTGITRGPHLHFEWHLGRDARDPMKRMVGQPTRSDEGPLAALSPYQM
jgi:murein DD-endopeptidase MepM/ murein hydrolase activator NlpD